MLTDLDMHPTLATADAGRARQWFADMLGWQPSKEFEGYLRYELGRSAFAVYESPSAGTARNTVMEWRVADTVAEVGRLKARGVTFEEYDFDDFKTVDGVMTAPDGMRRAWFRDADGNIIGMFDSVDPTGIAQANEVEAMLASSDLEHSKAWYGKLGYEPLFEVEGVIVGYRSGNSAFNVYQTSYAGTAKNTVAAFGVPDIRAEMADLRSRGVVFEDYSFGDIQTVDGLLADTDGSANAWFKDPDGNIIGIEQRQDEPG